MTFGNADSVSAVNSSSGSGLSKNGIFRVYTVKTTETGMKMMYIVVLLYVLLDMYARKVPFCPSHR